MVNKNIKILVVDDDQVVCDVVSQTLAMGGYRCTTVLRSGDALDKLATEKFNLVVLDIKLPDMSGIEVLRQIQSKRNDTPVIMLSAVNDVDTAVEAMKLGASDYIVKPFGLDRLDKSVRMALEAEQPVTN